MNELELIQAENTAQLQRAKLDEFYNSLEQSDAEFLQVKEYRLAQIVGNAKTEMGKEFKEAQDRLASFDNTKGIFVKWIALLDISVETVYKLIHRYNYLFNNIERKDFIEALPLSLSYEVTKPNAPKELVDKVLNGDITTHKEYIEQKKLFDELKSKNQTLQDNLFSVQSEKSEYETKVKELESQLQKVNEVLEVQMNKPPVEIEVIKYEAPAELLQQKQLIESQLKDLQNKEKQRLETINEQKKELKEIADENFTYQRQLMSMKSERERLESKIQEMQNTVEELSMYKKSYYDIEEAQATLLQYETDLANMRIKIQDTNKFVEYTSNIKDFINSNLVPMLTTLHLPEEDKMIKQDFQLICKTLEEWVFAIKQIYKLN